MLNDEISPKEKALLSRLKRIEGQVRGIEKMVTDGRSCISVVQQIMAVRSAMSQVATKILAQESCKCEYKNKPDEMEKILRHLVDMN